MLPAAGVQDILRRIERIRGFVLLPVEVPGPDVASGLAGLLDAAGHPVILVEPRDEAGWKGLVASLEGARPEPGGVVVLIGSRSSSPEVRAALRLLNEHRDTVSSKLGCPLLWCGTAEFLNLTWETAPDFWSIRATDVRLTEPPASVDAAPAAGHDDWLRSPGIDILGILEARVRDSMSRFLELVGDPVALQRSDTAARSQVMCRYAESTARVLMDGALCVLWESDDRVDGAFLPSVGETAQPLSPSAAREATLFARTAVLDHRLEESIALNWLRKEDGTEAVHIFENRAHAASFWLVRPAADASSPTWRWFKSNLPQLKSSYVILRALMAALTPGRPPERITESPALGAAPPAGSGPGAELDTSALEAAGSSPEDMRSRIAALQRLFDAARSQKDRWSAARFAVRLADAFIALGKLDEAHQILTEVASATPDELRAELLLRQATLARRRGKPVFAAATLGDLLGLPEVTPHVWLNAQLTMATLLDDAGELASAEARYRRVLEAARQTGDREAEVRALIGAGVIAARTERAAESEAPLAEARALARRLGDRELEARAAAAQATAAARGYDVRRSEERMSEAEGLPREAVEAPPDAPSLEPLDTAPPARARRSTQAS